jgi:hypothetical protein
MAHRAVDVQPGAGVFFDRDARVADLGEAAILLRRADVAAEHAERVPILELLDLLAVLHDRSVELPGICAECIASGTSVALHALRAAWIAPDLRANGIRSGPDPLISSVSVSPRWSTRSAIGLGCIPAIGVASPAIVFVDHDAGGDPALAAGVAFAHEHVHLLDEYGSLGEVPSARGREADLRARIGEPALLDRVVGPEGADAPSRDKTPGAGVSVLRLLNRLVMDSLVGNVGVVLLSRSK